MVVCTDSYLQKLENGRKITRHCFVNFYGKREKKIIENLTKNVFDQERRLEILEKICKICGLLFYEINKINFLCLIQTKVEHYIPLPF